MSFYGIKSEYLCNRNSIKSDFCSTNVGFTAIGQIKEREPYQVDMGNDGFCPFRRDVRWFESQEAAIIPLLNQLDFTKNKKNWGYKFRFGLIEISEHDIQQISIAMRINNIRE